MSKTVIFAIASIFGVDEGVGIGGEKFGFAFGLGEGGFLFEE